MNIREINEILEKFIITEMAIINNTIEVNNEDIFNAKGVLVNKKYPHFHWVHKNKRNIHFKFANRCPENTMELKRLVVVDSEVNRLSAKDCKAILSDLKRTITEGQYKGMMTYDAAFYHWKLLHNYRENIENEIVQL